MSQSLLDQRIISGMNKEIARLTRELAEAQQTRERAESAWEKSRDGNVNLAKLNSDLHIERDTLRGLLRDILPALKPFVGHADTTAAIAFGSEYLKDLREVRERITAALKEVEE